MYTARTERYDFMPYRRSGRSGLPLPALSLGLWHNFGGVDSLSNSRAMPHLAQMALAGVLRDSRMTSVIIGASKVEQIDQNVAALRNLRFSEDELRRKDGIPARDAVVS